MMATTTDGLAYWRESGLATQEVERRAAMPAEEFISDYYSRPQPVIIEGGVSDWPALSKWLAPAYLLERLPPKEVAVTPAESAFAIGEDRDPPGSEQVQLHDYL